MNETNGEKILALIKAQLGNEPIKSLLPSIWLTIDTINKATIDSLQREINIRFPKVLEYITAKSLSSQKNDGIHEWELKTPKEVRAGSVNNVCKAIKTGISNFKAGNIKYFRLGFRKRKENYKSVVIPKNFLKNNYGTIQLAPEFFKENCKFKMERKQLRNINSIFLERVYKCIFYNSWTLSKKQ